MEEKIAYPVLQLGTVGKKEILFYLDEHLMESMIYLLTFYVREGSDWGGGNAFIPCCLEYIVKRFNPV